MDAQPAPSTSTPSPVLVQPTIEVVAPPAPKATMSPQKGRNLILCFDGTSNQFDGDVSPLTRLLHTRTHRLAEHKRRQVLLFAQEG